MIAELSDLDGTSECFIHSKSNSGVNRLGLNGLRSLRTRAFGQYLMSWPAGVEFTKIAGGGLCGGTLWP
jgi:hypothetical protein